MFKTIKNAWSLPDLRKKILFTLLIIVVFRIGSVIQVPFLDTAALRSVMNPDDWSNTMLSYMNTLSGGAFSNATLFAMGITPYINSSIIIQLLCVAIPPLEKRRRSQQTQNQCYHSLCNSRSRYYSGYCILLLPSQQQGNTLQQWF